MGLGLELFSLFKCAWGLQSSYRASWTQQHTGPNFYRIGAGLTDSGEVSGSCWGRGNSGSGNFRHLDANFRHLDANFRHLGFPEFSRIFRFQVARHTLKSQLSGGFRGLYSFIYLARHAMSPGKGELQSNLHHVLPFT